MTNESTSISPGTPHPLDSANVSTLTATEKRALEKFLSMDSGYVLEFSNRTFAEFVEDSVGVDIRDEKYDSGSGSKANRLRTLWLIETDAIVGRLLRDLIDYAEVSSEVDPFLRETCGKIADRLIVAGPPLALPTSPDTGFNVLATAIRESIDKHRPAEGLDRLHTYVVKYLRQVCEKHGITTTRDKPLNSLMGEYVKRLRAEGRIESEMAERILKSSISVLTAYDDVRNNQSLAHDNQVPGEDECLLILHHVATTIRFIEAIERR